VIVLILGMAVIGWSNWLARTAADAGPEAVSLASNLVRVLVRNGEG